MVPHYKSRLSQQSAKKEAYRQDERRSDSNCPCRVDTNALTHNLLAVSLHLKSFVNRQSDSCSAEFHFESSVRACANTEEQNKLSAEEQNKGRCVKLGWAGNGWISWLPYSSKHDEMGLTRPANTYYNHSWHPVHFKSNIIRFPWKAVGSRFRAELCFHCVWMGN